jgi:hypothetical protein
MATPQTHTEGGTTEVWASLGWNRYLPNGKDTDLQVGAGSLSKDDIYQLLCTYKLSVRVYPLNGSWSIMRLHVLFSIVIVESTLTGD